MTSIRLLTFITIGMAIVSGAAAAGSARLQAQAEPAESRARVPQGSDRGEPSRVQADRADDVRADRDQRRADRRQRPHEHRGRRADPVLSTVANHSLASQAGYGWQYFSDPRAIHAVVISPAGEYFLRQH